MAQETKPAEVASASAAKPMDPGARAHQLMDDVAPKLADITDKVLFSDVWERPGLSKHDRSLVTVAALIAMGRAESLRSHLELALQNGVTREELVEEITHLAFYTGWPNAVAAIGVARETFARNQSASATAKTTDAEIFKANSGPFSAGEPGNFTGDAKITSRYRTAPPSHGSGGTVAFGPGGRTAWHSHPLGQTLIVLSGHGIVQTWGSPAHALGPGDIAWIPAGVKHWHGAAPKEAMTHVGIADVQNGNTVTWMEKVSDTQYGEAARSSR
jgi:4-carboxymuconolactone decarboxylase